MEDAWNLGRRGIELMPALHRNRELWATFSAACGAPGNALPDTLRASIISIALWVDRQTSAVIAGREPLGDLLEINRTLIEGLG